LNQCADGSWCCVDSNVYASGTGVISNVTCCQNGQDEKIGFRALTTTLPTVVSTTSQTAASYSSLTAASYKSLSSSNTTLRVGLGVGFGVGIPILAGIILLVVRDRKGQKSHLSAGEPTGKGVIPEWKGQSKL